MLVKGMSSKKHKIPAIRFKGFTDAWEQRKLGELINLENGFAFKSEYFQEDPSDLIVLTPGNVNIGGGFQSGKGRFYNIAGKFPDKFIFKPGDIFVTMTDLTPSGQTLGLPAIVPDDGITYLHNQRLGKLVNFSGDREFLFYVFNTEDYHKHIVATASGTTVKHSSSSKILDYVVHIPIIEEQTKIGAFLNKLDNTIALHQRELDNLKITKQVFMKKMFPKEGEKVPEVRFPGFMADWDYRKLGDVGETYTGLSGKSKDDFGHGRGKYVTYMNVFSNSIANPSLVELVEIDTKQNEVNPGDIFFTTSSETPEEVGMSSVWLENSDNTYLNSFCFGYRPIEKFDNYYLAYMLRSSVVRKKITFLAQGISRYNISKNKVMDIAVPIPVIEEQTKIGEFFKQLDDIINLQQQELEKLKQTKQAFLQKMFI